jgi:hypothetical protein
MGSTIEILLNSIGLVRDQMIETFGRETPLVDKEAIDIIFSSSKNRDKLIEKLNVNTNSSIEIVIEGHEFSFSDQE